MNVEFGHSKPRHAVRRHNRPARRDSAQTVAITVTQPPPSVAQSSTLNQGTTISIVPAPGSVATLSSSTPPNQASVRIFQALNVTIPTSSAPFPSATPLHFDLGHQKLDQNVNLPLALSGISVGCKNCTTSGSLDLTGGSFSIDLNNLSGKDSVIQNGTLMISMAEGFQAHVELSTNLSSQASFDVPIFDLPSPVGFTVRFRS